MQVHSQPSDPQRSDSPSCKIQYERNFLLQFRTCFTTESVPPGLEDFHKNFQGTSSSAPPSPVHNPDAPHKKSHSAANTPRHRAPTTPTNGAHVTFGVLEHRADVAFNSKEQQRDDTAAVVNQIRGVLNKLTLEKYELLSASLKTSALLDSQEVMESAILLIFEKAIWEPEFSEMYATLCSDLCQAEMERRRADGAVKTGQRNSVFRRVLLQQCQREFERRDTECTTLVDETSSKQRRRKTGNIRFVGELFKKGMLTEKIIQQVVLSLLFSETQTQTAYDPPDYDIDILCSLFETVGKLVDTPQNHAFVDTCFQRISQLAQSPKYPPRSRFLLMDTIDLRRNNWNPRKQALKAAKLQDLEQQIAEVEHEKAVMLAQAATPRHSHGPNTPTGTALRQRPPGFPTTPTSASAEATRHSAAAFSPAAAAPRTPTAAAAAAVGGGSPAAPSPPATTTTAASPTSPTASSAPDMSEFGIYVERKRKPKAQFLPP